MNKDLFDKCIKEAIEMGRKYMLYGDEDESHPTQQEWDLALVIFKHKLKNEN